MAEGNGTKPFFSLRDAVVLGTTIAGIAASWALMSSQIGELARDVASLSSRADNLGASFAVLSERTRVLEVQYDNLRDIVIELRRQSALQPVDPPLP